jgi:hypothetical protein
MGLDKAEGIKSVEGDEEQLKLPLVFTHVYDDVEINTAVPWPELSEKTQALCIKVVDYYKMQSSINTEADIDIRQLNITQHDPEKGLMYSLIAVVEPLGDNEIDVDTLFELGDDDGD